MGIWVCSSSSNPQDLEEPEVRMKVPEKRSREKTLRQLIKMCKASGEGEDLEDMDPQLLQLQGMLSRLKAKPVYIKR